MRGRAYAKVNLSLEVTGKRPDCFHELVSIMQTVSLHDELQLEPADELVLECDDARLAGPDNLVLRAGKLVGRGGRFRLKKAIPVAGGMGGGSSDGALALRLLDAVYGLRLAHGELLAAASELGSDVPFFLDGGTALVQGRGERVTPLADVPVQWLVVLNPGVSLSTAAVFRELDAKEYGRGDASLAWASRPVGVPPALNTLAGPARRLEPAIEAAFQRLAALGVIGAMLSGSGPTVFGLCADESQARSVAANVGGWPARFVGREEALRLEDE